MEFLICWLRWYLFLYSLVNYSLNFEFNIYVHNIGQWKEQDVPTQMNRPDSASSREHFDRPACTDLCLYRAVSIQPCSINSRPSEEALGGRFAKCSIREPTKTDSAEDNQNHNQASESMCSLFISYTRAVTQTKWHINEFSNGLWNRLYHACSN